MPFNLQARHRLWVYILRTVHQQRPCPKLHESPTTTHIVEAVAAIVTGLVYGRGGGILSFQEPLTWFERYQPRRTYKRSLNLMVNKIYLFFSLAILCLSACSQPTTPPANNTINTPQSTPATPITPTPENQTPLPTQQNDLHSDITPTITPPLPKATRDCSQKTYFPPTVQGNLEPAAPGTTIEITGFGGYYQDNCGGYDESAQYFTLSFDQEPVGEFSCYASSCRAFWTIPLDTPLGEHTLSIADVTSFQLDVIEGE